MNIVIVGPDKDEKGGIATVINNLSTEMATKDLAFFTYSSWRSGGFFYRLFYSLIQLLRFPRFLKKNKIDFVYIHFAHKGSFSRKKVYAKIAKNYQKKVILHSHSSSFDKFYKNAKSAKKKSIQRFFMDSCDTLIVLGEFWKVFYASEIQVPDEKIKILHNAVTCPENHSYDSSSHIVTMFGRLGERKGTYDVLKAAKKFQDNDYDVQFKLYGDGEIEKVHSLIQEYQLENLSIEDWVTNDKKKEKMSEAVLNILPSYHEGMPMAILETMALGVPNAASNAGSIEEVIKNEHNGFVICPGDVDSLYKVIESYIYHTDYKYKAEMSNRARKTIEQEFNLMEYRKKLEEILMDKGEKK
ncbi:hypothetical protein UA3_02535 [Enterococcus faecium EnGen0263]|uniref:glycosyltransferase family 4 protein n=1 Tax=Enterococcus faecium TaxID=1352 RepID=UPI00032EEC8D|nr:glycosyltransferase [Enterococcus faecium]EOH52845.1 hypothetical protein UA3_02535 [Enterococcus faecium EnGen0263]